MTGSRRGFLKGALLGGLAGAVLGARSGAEKSEPTPARRRVSRARAAIEATEGSTFVHPWRKLAAIGGPAPRVQLFVVSYLNASKKSLASRADPVLADVEASLEGGADAVVLINEYSEPLADLERVVVELRQRFPRVPLGVNYLGDDREPYGYRESFRLAREHELQLVWTDFSGVDLIEERPPADLHAIQAARPAGVFYASGIHMKYSTLKDPRKPLEQSALEAMGYVDGIIVTGPKTGVASDPDRVRRARSVIGDYPLGVASGTSAENVGAIREWIDFCLVHTSLQVEHRIVASKVRELRRALDGAPPEAKGPR